MRTRTILVGFAACLVGAAVFGGAMVARSGSSGYPAKPDANTQTQLQAVADRLVTADLDPTASTPTQASVVLSTRGDAIPVAGGWGEGNDPGTPVYLVEIQGRFVSTRSLGPGTPDIKGQTLWFFFDPQLGRETDWGISPQQQDAASLGALYTFPLSVDATPGPSQSPAGTP